MGRQDALVDRDTVAPPHQRRALPRHVELQREVVGALVPADVQDVAKALGGEHPHLGAVVFDGNVGGHRGAVDDQVHLVGADASLGAQFKDAAHDGDGLVLKGGRDFV
ncbi:hypothetical protein D3C80_1834500 [compost metagenome]